MAVIWIPDGEPFEVEWYTSEGKAVGVNSISTGFMRHDVGPKRTGFQPPRHDVIDGGRFGPSLVKKHSL